MNTKTLLLLRHAKSSWDDPALEDFDRPLAPRGVRASQLMGRYIDKAGLTPALVLCSTALRARQTWAQLLLQMHNRVEIEYDDKLYLSEPAEMVARLGQVDDDISPVMIIAHDPGMHRLAIRLTGSGDAGAVERMRVKFPTAALAEIEIEVDRWQDVAPMTGRLRRFIRPRDLE